MKLKIKRGAAPRKEVEVLKSIWRKSPSKYYCISTKSPTGRWKDNFFKKTEMNKAVDLAIKSTGCDVYMSTHGFSRSSRHKDFSDDPALCYADLDEADPRTIAIKPTIAIETSPGRYVGYWLTDEPASEDLNRRLSYFVGADPSGWDRTQVLRVPGTTNHKRSKKFRVKVLWVDGPRYEVARLEKMVPELSDDTTPSDSTEAMEIYREYQNKLPRSTRRELTHPQVKQGKRSEVLWKIMNDCMEAGMTEDEIFTVCWNSPWNKHIDRRNGEKVMMREIEKVMGNHISGSNKKPKKRTDEYVLAEPDDEGDDFDIITMDMVEEEQIDWWIKYMFAFGETAIVEADPGIGKSYLMQWLSTFICDGKLFPWQDPRKDKPIQGRVLYCDMENSMGSVSKSRLNDNGLKNQSAFMQLDKPFSVTDDESFERFIRLIIKFRPKVVIVDPINVYIGNTDTYRASETQQALHKLSALAKQYGFALIIVRHLNKGATGKALYAGNGSIAFAGVARTIISVGWHPEEADMRVVACAKTNLGKGFGSFGYTIEPLPDTLDKKDRSQLVYEGHVDYTADEILGGGNVKEEGSQAIAADLIREIMDREGNEINYHSVIKQADARSISETSVKKAAHELGMKKVSRGRGKNRQTLLVMPNENQST